MTAMPESPYTGWNIHEATDMLAQAPALLAFEDVPPDAQLRLDVQYPYGELAIATLVFRKSPAPQLMSAETEWVQERPGSTPRPVVLYGACIAGGAVTEPGTVKAGAGFIFYTVDTFRSREATAELTAMPPPETLDSYLLEALRDMNRVVEGIDGQLYWQMPAEYNETGPVLQAGWSLAGARAGDAGES
jgi:hypothetical protein